MKPCSILVVLWCLSSPAVAHAQTYRDWRRAQNVEVAAAMKATGHASIEVKMINDRNRTTIMSRLGADGDETTDQILRFASR